MKNSYLSLLFVVLSAFAFGQLTEQFTDGNFTANPVWSGTTSDYLVNTSLELQLNNTIAATSYISTAHGLSDLNNKEWDILVRQTFAPSSSNFGKVYLTATNADLTTNPDGFYLLFGEANATDAVRLFKIISGVSTQICASPDGQIAASFTTRVKVKRDATGMWSLFVDPSGGTNFGAPYTGTDATVLLGTHFGMLQTYTASNANKFYYDDIYVGNEILDTQAPTSVTANSASATQVDLLFNEPIGGSAATLATNYTLNPALSVSSAVIDGTNTALVHLTLSSPLTNGQNYDVTVTSIQDLAGNTASNLTCSFSYLIPEIAVKGDLIINEIMVDPSPVVGLPELEFVEIYNRSNKYIDLTGWKIGDASGDGTIGSAILGPGAYKVLVATSSVPDFPGSVAVSSFPSYNNGSDDVVLKDPSGFIMDKISYTDSWYQDAIKKNGGYTLELINPNDPCSDNSNWRASIATLGGTPGMQNSIFDITPDLQAPFFTTLNAQSPNYLEIIFNEGIDSSSLVNAMFTINPSLTVQSIYVTDTFSTSAILQFSSNLVASQTYTITINTVKDCWLNATTLTGDFALAEIPVPGDLIINELLFDPLTGGSDFVELYNKSQKVINLNGLEIANIDNDTIANNKQLTQNYFLFPGQYVVLTPDSIYQKNNFPMAVPGRFYEMNLPSLNNDSSTVLIISNSTVIDRVSYRDSWHLPLLDSKENKSLERISPEGLSSSKSNWHTAAETVGFATPGRVNSQYLATENTGTFGTNEPIFSPDNDGFQDVILFEYSFETPGMIADLKIYDNQGREVKNLLQSELMAVSGFVSWDGSLENSQKAPIGIYIAVIEAFNPDGSKSFAKRVAFTLAGKL